MGSGADGITGAAVDGHHHDDHRQSRNHGAPGEWSVDERYRLGHHGGGFGSSYWADLELAVLGGACRIAFKYLSTTI
jgi:hypothetical protein